MKEDTQTRPSVESRVTWLDHRLFVAAQLGFGLVGLIICLTISGCHRAEAKLPKSATAPTTSVAGTHQPDGGREGNTTQALISDAGTAPPPNSSSPANTTAQLITSRLPPPAVATDQQGTPRPHPAAPNESKANQRVGGAKPGKTEDAQQEYEFNLYGTAYAQPVIGRITLWSEAKEAPESGKSRVLCGRPIPEDARRIRFNDGIEVSFSQGSQAIPVCNPNQDLDHIALDHGSALFDTSRRKADRKPFLVRTPVGEIEDQGTAFSVATTNTASLIFVWADSVLAKAMDKNMAASLSVSAPATLTLAKGEVALLQDKKIIALNLPEAIQKTLKDHKEIVWSWDKVDSLQWKKEKTIKAEVRLANQNSAQRVEFSAVPQDLQQISPVTIDPNEPIQVQGRIKLVGYDPKVLEVTDLEMRDKDEWSPLSPSVPGSWKILPIHRSADARLRFRVDLKVHIIDPSGPNAKEDTPYSDETTPTALTIAWTWTGFWSWVMALPAALKGTFVGSLLIAILTAIYKDKIYPFLRRQLMAVGIRLPEKPPEPEKSEEKPSGDAKPSGSAKVESAGTETEAKKIDGTKQEAQEPSSVA